MANLSEKKVAILTENGFEEVELTSPKQALEAAGVTVDIVSPQRTKVKAWDKDHWSIELPVDAVLPEDADVEEYDLLIIPGGVINPDKMRLNPDCINFVETFIATGKPVAAICHGPQLLIETGFVRGKEMTSFPSIKTDLINAGAEWVDEAVVVDGQLITSRSPKDLEAFNGMLLETLEKGVPQNVF
jgi:protease I